MYNFHNHTYRCGHATGTDEEYVLEAIKNGYEVMGFSDHAPYLFPKITTADTEFSLTKHRITQTQ